MIRSESLRRLHVEHPVRNYGNDAARAEIQSHVEEFLARGGLIKQVASFHGVNREGMAVVDSISGNVVSLPGREEVDGTVLVTIKVVASMVNLSVTNIRKRAHDGRFPKPVTTRPQWRWDEEAVKAWLQGAGRDGSEA